MRGARADGETIKRLRTARGLTQEHLAGLAACDVKTVRSAEGAHNMDLYTLGKIATALEVPFPEIVQQSDDANSEQQARIDTVRQYWAAFVAQDVEAIMDLFHDDIVMHLPGAPEIPFAGEYRGKEEVRRMHETAFQTGQTTPTAPDATSFFACDDFVFAHGAAEMKGHASEVGAELTFIHAIRFEGPKIIEVSTSYDSLAMNKVLKAPPPPTGPVEVFPTPPKVPGNFPVLAALSGHVGGKPARKFATLTLGCHAVTAKRGEHVVRRGSSRHAHPPIGVRAWHPANCVYEVPGDSSRPFDS